MPREDDPIVHANGLVLRQADLPPRREQLPRVAPAPAVVTERALADLLDAQISTLVHLRDQLEQRIDALAASVGQRIAQLEGRIEQLTDRVQALETRKTMRFAGTWDAAQVYHEGDVVIRQSAVWVCRALETRDSPGARPESWTLAVKSADRGGAHR